MNTHSHFLICNFFEHFFFLVSMSHFWYTTLWNDPYIHTLAQKTWKISTDTDTQTYANMHTNTHTHIHTQMHTHKRIN